MDGVSTALCLIGNAYKAIMFVKKTFDDVKNAPKELQALREKIEDIDLLITELQIRRFDGLFQSGMELKVLERRGRRAQECLQDVTDFVQHMIQEKAGEGGDQSVNKIKWLRKGSKLVDLKERLDRLEDSLTSLIGLINSRSHSSLALMVQDVRASVNQTNSHVVALTQCLDNGALHVPTRVGHTPIGPTSRLTTGPSNPEPKQGTALVPPSQAQTSCFAEQLEISPVCTCRHYVPFTDSVVPSMLEPILGQLTISGHKSRLKSRKCKSPACRRGSRELKWSLPGWLVEVKFFSMLKSIYATRLIPKNAEVWSVILNEDLFRLQLLFREHAASIHDMDKNGATLLHVACIRWYRTRSENSQKIVKFLAEAGADLDFQPGRAVSAKKVLFIASLATLVNNPICIFAHRIQTDPLSINICHSAFGIDFSDLAADVFNRRSDGEELQAALGFTTPPDNHSSLLDVGTALQRLTSFTPLEYAIHYMTSEDVLRILQNGAEPSQGAPVAVAVDGGYDDLLEPLLEAGADINAIDRQGFSALHWACYHARLDILQVLIRLAGDKIDWHARTRDGTNRNALQLAKACPWWDLDRRPTSWRKVMLNILRKRGFRDEDEDAPPKMPGGFD